MTKTLTSLVALAIALAAPYGETAQLPAPATESPTIPNLPDVDSELLVSWSTTSGTAA
jgi:hypothetical protein